MRFGFLLLHYVHKNLLYLLLVEWRLEVRRIQQHPQRRHGCCHLVPSLGIFYSSPSSPFPFFPSTASYLPPAPSAPNGITPLSSPASEKEAATANTKHNCYLSPGRRGQHGPLHLHRNRHTSVRWLRNLDHLAIPAGWPPGKHHQLTIITKSPSSPTHHHHQLSIITNSRQTCTPLPPCLHRLQPTGSSHVLVDGIVLRMDAVPHVSSQHRSNRPEPKRASGTDSCCGRTQQPLNHGHASGSPVSPINSFLEASSSCPSATSIIQHLHN